MTDPLHGWQQRRREAARHLRPLNCPGRCHDPLLDCICEEPPPITEQMVAAAVAAAQHLRDENLPPIFDTETLRAMWRSGHHQLVDELRGTA